MKIAKFLICLIAGSIILANNSLRMEGAVIPCRGTDWYVGVEGGFATSLGKTKDQIGTGPIIFRNNAIATNAEFLPGWQTSAKLGVGCLSCLRLEACYTFYHSNYNWQIVFGNLTDNTDNLVKAQIDVHTALFNVYLHLDRLCGCRDFLGPVSPYLIGGLGAAWNHLYDMEEFTNDIILRPPFLLGKIQRHVHSNFAGRCGLGLLTEIGCGFRLDTGFHITYIGTVKTGNRRYGGLIIPVTADLNPYKFKNNWLGSFYVGLHYAF